MIEAVQGYAGVKLSKIGPSESRMVNNPGYILDSTNRIDEVRTATECTVALLRERRAALIAAAVTGQIDVEYAK